MKPDGPLARDAASRLIAHGTRDGASASESVAQANGSSAVAAGLTTTLVQLFELLGRVIGDALTLKLAEQMKSGDTSGAAQGENDEQNAKRHAAGVPGLAEGIRKNEPVVVALAIIGTVSLAPPGTQYAALTQPVH